MKIKMYIAMLIVILLLVSCSNENKTSKTSQLSSNSVIASGEQTSSDTNILSDKSVGVLITPQILISDEETVEHIAKIIANAKPTTKQSNPFDCTPYVVEFRTKEGAVGEYVFNGSTIKKIENGVAVAWFECDDATFEYIKELCK